MQRIYTERAHLMCPNMCFGIVITIDAVFDMEKINKTVHDLSAAHPFLQAILGQDETGYYYKNTDTIKVQILYVNEEVSGVDDPIIIREYNNLTKKEWDLEERGCLRSWH